MINGVSDRNRGRKSMNLPMFSGGYFCMADTGWRLPPGVNDNDLIKQTELEPFEGLTQEPPRKWSAEEDRALKKGIIEAASRPVLRNVRQSLKRSARESNDSKLKKLNTDLHKYSKQSERDLIGARDKEYDWDVISITHLKSLRTAEECRLRWKSAAHLDIKRSYWSGEEKKTLRKWIKKFGEDGAWTTISEKMINRTAMQCFIQWGKMQNDEEKGRPWTKEEDAILLKAVGECQLDESEHIGVNWNTVAAQLNGRTPQQCTHRWKKSTDPRIKRGGWTVDEDIKLLRAVQEMGEEWARIRDSKVLEDADGTFRTDMQMRDRFHNALSHGHIRGPWTEEEDKLLEEGHRIYGNQWTMVALHVQTRNDGQCLKRWHLREDHIARKKPIPYIKSTKACKVERIRTLKRMVAMEAHEKECHRQVARDPQLVILNKEVYHKDPAMLVEMNKEVISSMYPEMYGTEKNPLPAIMASATSGDPNSKAVLPKQLDAKGYQPDTYKRFQDVISRMRNKAKAAEHGLFFKHIIDIIKYKHAKGPHFGKVLRAVDRRRDEKAWMPPSGVPMRMTKKLYDSVARKELEGRARFMGNRPSIDRRRRNQLKAILKMTVSSSVALRTVIPQVDMMEGDSENLEADLNASLEASAGIAPVNYFVENMNSADFSGNLPIPMNYQSPCALPGPSSSSSIDSQGSSSNNEALEVGGRFVLLDGEGHERTAVELDHKKIFDAVMVDAP